MVVQTLSFLEVAIKYCLIGFLADSAKLALHLVCYTNKDGNRINVNFLYDRITASGYRMTSTMSFEFAIYKEAHWEIIVVFTAGAPLFEDGK